MRRFSGVPIQKVGVPHLISRVGIAQPLQRIAMGEIFRMHRDQRPGPPSLLYTGERVYFTGVQSESGADHLLYSSAEVENE